MLIKFWEGIGDQLSAQWFALLLTPAFVFWLGGFLVWVLHFGWGAVEQNFVHLPLPEQVTYLVLGLLLVVFSSVAVQTIARPLVRLCAGYWPVWPGWLNWPLLRVRNWCVQRQLRRMEVLAGQWQELANKGLKQLSVEESEAYTQLDQQLRQFPDDSALLPTRLGNCLRAAELRPWMKYGLDAVICWPHLWLLLPDEARQELSEARASVNGALFNLLWGVLFLVWTLWAWWAIFVGVAVALFAYWQALNAAEVYGNLLNAAFDLYRLTLYDALRWPQPLDTSDEKNSGQRLTEYLFRGTLDTPVTLQVPPVWPRP